MYLHDLIYIRFSNQFSRLEFMLVYAKYNIHSAL